MRRATCAVTAVLLAGAAVPASAGTFESPRPVSRVWRLRPVNDHPRQLHATVTFTFGDLHPAYGVARVRIGGGRRHVESGGDNQYAESAPWIQAGVADQANTPACPAEAACAYPDAYAEDRQATVHLEDDALDHQQSARAVPARMVLREFYLFTWNVRRTAISVPNWTVREVSDQGGRIRVFGDGDCPGTTYADTGGFRISHFRGISTPGGRWGSVAIAHGPSIGPGYPFVTRSAGGGFLWDGWDKARGRYVEGDATWVTAAVDGPTGPLGWIYQADYFTAATLETPWLVVLDLPRPA